MDKNTFKQLTLKANMGSPEAQFQLYQIYYDGDEELDIGWDPDNAVKWVQKAADQGYVPAIGELGMLWINGGIISMIDPAKGVAMEFEAADKGYVKSMYRVGNYLFTGKTDGPDTPGQYVDRDPDRAIEYWKKAAEQGCLEAGLAYAKAFIIGVGEDQDFSSALTLLNTLIDLIDPEDDSKRGLLSQTQFWIGYLYYYGLGVQKDRIQADRWFARSVEGGFSPAEDVVQNQDDPREALMFWDYPYDYESWCQLYVGEDELTAPEDENPFNEAEDKYSLFTDEEVELGRRAMCGDYAALAKVGQLIVQDAYYYEDLLNVSWNETPENDSLYQEGYNLFFEDRYVEAIEKFKIPAYNGYEDAMYCLGECYFRYWNEGGETPAGDPEWDDDFCWGEAFKWYLIGACNYHRHSQYKLAEAYYYGRVPSLDGKMEFQEDYPAAKVWFENAAADSSYEKGLADAANFLGTMYDDGLIDGSRNHEKAIEYYRKAAERSDKTLGWYNLGLSYENGEGVPKDLDKAMECYGKLADSYFEANARYAILEYNRNPGNQAAREDAIRRLKDASTYSETARNVLEQLGMS